LCGEKTAVTDDAGAKLAGVGVLRGVPAAALATLAQRCCWRRYKPKQEIVGYREDDRDVYFIVEGTARVTIYSFSGREVAFRDLHAGDSFGEVAAIDGGPRSASVVALTEVLIARLAPAAFWELLRAHPSVAEATLKRLAGLIRRLSDRVVEFSTLGVSNRIHAELLRLARSHRSEGGRAVIAPAPTHAEIASRVSTHREAVSRELSELARAGLIERRNGTLLIRDLERLARMVDEVRGG
jgi:CRP/FNR family transcriptional regulator, cyclic AMP receptor protein